MRRLDRLFLFSYYGGKSRVAKKYPKPLHDTIIEPFAGAANYSCLYYQKKIILYEINPVVFGILSFLIRSSSKDILAIPLIGKDQLVRDVSACEEARNLIGFLVGAGVTEPRSRMTPWGKDKKRQGTTWNHRVRFQLSCIVEEMKHWVVLNQTCWEAFDQHRKNKEVTWFLDPPYQGRAGKCYKFGSDLLDYALLGNECQKLKGHVIVCENEGADWLPFSRLFINSGTLRRQQLRWEMIWTKNNPEKMGFGL